MICLRLDLLLGVWIRKYVFNYVENGIDYCKMLLLAYFDICENDVYYCCENPRHQVDFFFRMRQTRTLQGYGAWRHRYLHWVYESNFMNNIGYVCEGLVRLITRYSSAGKKTRLIQMKYAIDLFVQRGK